MKNIVTLSILFIQLVAGASAWAEIPKLAFVEPGIFRGGQPETVEDYQVLKALGVRTILNLRQEKDLIENEKNTAATFSIQLINVPMSGFFAPSDSKVREALAALDNPAYQPVFVHCQHGKDRTGLIIGLHHVLEEGWSRDDAYSEMRDFGFNPVLAGLTYYFWIGSRDL